MPSSLFFAFLLPQGVAPLRLLLPLLAGLDGAFRFAPFLLGLECLLRLGAGEASCCRLGLMRRSSAARSGRGGLNRSSFQCRSSRS